MKPLLSGLLFFAAMTTSGQPPSGIGPNTTAAPNPSQTIFLADIQGKRLTDEWSRPYVKGSPFFVNEWSMAEVTLKNNRKYVSLMKINCVNNMVHFMDASGNEMEALPSQIASIKLTDSSGGLRREYDFATGYPAIDKNNEYTLYEKQIDGKIQVLSITKKRLVQTKTMHSAVAEQEFVAEESYYLFKDGVMKSWKKGKAFLLELLADKKEQLKEYIDSNKLTCKSIADCKQVIAWYNAL